ncbi:amino acid transporter avt1i [Quercus suber]|uniref:Amino acid transporter avt1i n=1 Tax=Quercus suber TaxID=58331 RepID=A0AAW0LUY9_QUESU
MDLTPSIVEVSNPSIKTYPDLGYHAFGRKGRIIVSTFTYLELYLVPTGMLILEGNNLFKTLHWMKRNFCNRFRLRVVSCRVTSILWVGAVDGVGFCSKGKLFELAGIPNAISLYAFCYGAHPVFPTLYSSVKDKSQFLSFISQLQFKPNVLFVSFSLSTLSYILMAFLGY